MTNIEAILEKFQEFNPDPKCEIVYDTDFNFLVGIVLSAQTTDKRVNMIGENLFKIIKTPVDVINFGIENLEESIKSLGFFRTKSKNIYSMAERLVKEFDGNVPYDFDALITLPGVGRKTASVFLNTLTGGNYIAVDTHVQRLAKRLGFSKGNTPFEIEQDLKNNIPERFQSKISNWLVLHGRYICKAKNPSCEKCFIKDLCESNDKK